MPGTAAAALGGPVDLALPTWPPQLRTVPATVAPAALVVRSPLAGHHAGLRARPRTGPPGRVVPVNTRLDTGRSNDPAVMSVRVWPEHFELHLTWDAYVTLGELMGTGWPARDDLGHHYHGVACNGHGGAVTSLSLVFAPVLAPGARKLTLTLPDLVSTPVTRAGALHATVALRPDRG